MEDVLSGELVFLDTLPKRNDGKIPVLAYRKPTRSDQYLHYKFQCQTVCQKSVVSSLFNRAYSIFTNKDDVFKKNTRIKQVLKKKKPFLY